MTVVDTFTPGQVAAMAAAGTDVRLRYAAEHAEDGRITQYLAGAPELETRYRTAGPAARALIQVAMDARRLGHHPAIPHAILKQAAPGYLDGHDWDNAGEDWLEQALADTARPCKGARGPLTRIRSRPGQHTPDDGPHYRLADYLEQTGRNERAGVYPPDSLWTTFVAMIVEPGLLRNFGWQAHQRGRYQHAIWLWTLAANQGDLVALREFERLREQTWHILGPETALARDRRVTLEADELAALQEEADANVPAGQTADEGDTGALRGLAWLRQEAGDVADAEALYRRAADLGDLIALRGLAELREAAGDSAGAEALAEQAADLGDIGALRDLAGLREQAGDPAGAEALYRRAADRGDTGALQDIAGLREQAGDPAGAAILAVRAADLGDTVTLRELAGLRQDAGDVTSAEALYRQAADRGDIFAMRELAHLRADAGDAAGAEAWAALAADYGETYYGKTEVLRELAGLREEAGDFVSAENLCRQAVDRGDIFALRLLADIWDRSGDVAKAGQLRRFGLDGAGEVATELRFDQPTLGM